MLRRTFLGSALLAGAVPLAAQVTADSDAAAAVVATLAARLAEDYVIPATGRRYAAMLRAKLATGGYAGITEPAALAAMLTADLQAIAPDRHLRVVTAAGLPGRERAMAPPGPGHQAPPRAPTLQDAGWLATGVGYLRYTEFSGDPAMIDATAQFMRDHAGARALIIDSRYNGGGGVDEMNVFLPWLYAAETPLVTMEMTESIFARRGLPFDGPTIRRVAGAPGIVRHQHVVTPTADPRWRAATVFYLTSHRTASAAEHLALAFRHTGRATLIGETTGGANHFGNFVDLGRGLQAFVPIGRTVDITTGRDWEGGGIAPDIAVPATGALEAALRRAGALAA